MTPKARHPVSCIALAVIWQLVTLIPSTHAQTELHSTSSSTSTSNNPSDACTRALKTDGSTGAPVAHFPCLSFAPLSTTAAEAASPLSFSLSAQETPSVLSSSVTVPQSFNSTSPHAVSKSTVYTTLRSNDPATSTSAPKQVHTVTNGTLPSSGAASVALSQNSTTNFKSSVSTTIFTQDGSGVTNATMFPVMLQTVTYTTTICPSGGRV
jgi:hypothetical protein